jgi:4-hydroxy-3-methylbut-2-enyl diphosphate reductase
MEVILSAPRGFCAGVVRAIDIVEICLDYFGPPVYVRHEIVHNKYVVGTLREKGAIFVEALEEIPDNATVVFSAHGVAPVVWDTARARHLNVIDATCPLVTKVHLEAIKYAKDGYSVIVVGHKGHPEVIGTLGQVPNQSQLVGSVEEALKVEVDNPDRLVALTQTTLSVQDTEGIISALRTRFPEMQSRNDICYATTNRQAAVKELALQVDLVLVIGAQNSSNCNRLREVAQQLGLSAYLIDDASQIKEKWLEGVDKIGVTSGASTPDVLVDAVVNYLQPTSVRTLEVIREDVTFSLPKELRAITKGKLKRSGDRDRTGIR